MVLVVKDRTLGGKDLSFHICPVDVSQRITVSTLLFQELLHH